MILKWFRPRDLLQRLLQHRPCRQTYRQRSIITADWTWDHCSDAADVSVLLMSLTLRDCTAWPRRSSSSHRLMTSRHRPTSPRAHGGHHLWWLDRRVCDGGGHGCSDCSGHVTGVLPRGLGDTMIPWTLWTTTAAAMRTVMSMPAGGVTSTESMECLDCCVLTTLSWRCGEAPVQQW